VSSGRPVQGQRGQRTTSTALLLNNGFHLVSRPPDADRKVSFPGSPGWRGGCLACLLLPLPWPGRSRGRPSRSQPTMRDWCAGRSWVAVPCHRVLLALCCLFLARGQRTRRRSEAGESRAQAPREPARRILFLPCMQGQQDTARHGPGVETSAPCPPASYMPHTHAPTKRSPLIFLVPVRRVHDEIWRPCTRPYCPYPCCCYTPPRPSVGDGLTVSISDARTRLASSGLAAKLICSD
jgi:hypothetical protein